MAVNLVNNWFFFIDHVFDEEAGLPAYWQAECQSWKDNEWPAWKDTHPNHNVHVFKLSHPRTEHIWHPSVSWPADIGYHVFSDAPTMQDFEDVYDAYAPSTWRTKFSHQGLILVAKGEEDGSLVRLGKYRQPLPNEDVCLLVEDSDGNRIAAGLKRADLNEHLLTIGRKDDEDDEENVAGSPGGVELLHYHILDSTYNNAMYVDWYGDADGYWGQWHDQLESEWGIKSNRRFESALGDLLFRTPVRFSGFASGKWYQAITGGGY